MKRKAVAFIMLTLVVMSTLTLAFNIFPARAQFETFIYIMADGSIDPPTVPILRVDDLYILTDNIFGVLGFIIERDNMVLDGAGYTVEGMFMGGIDVSGSNVTVQNMEIRAFDYGIGLQSSNNTISGNTITDNYVGVYLAGSNNTIFENNIANNWGVGIQLYWGSSNNSLTENIIENNQEVGIKLEYSSGNTLRGNIMVSNRFNFGVAGWSVSDFINDVDASNTVDGKPVYYWTNKEDATVPPDAGYVALVNCSRVTVEDLSLQNNQQGILLAFTQQSTLTQNTLTANEYGIELVQSSNITMFGNSIANNGAGVSLRSSSNNTISGNTITNNLMWESNVQNGIDLSLSSGNSIFRNNITNNSGNGILLSGNKNSVYGNSISKHSGNGISLIGADNSVHENSIASNMWGVSLSGTSNSVSGNNITANTYDGVVLSGGQNSIVGNRVENNGRYGIRVSSNGDISKNTVKGNGFGIFLSRSSSNEIIENNVIENRYSGIYLYSYWEHGIYYGSSSNNVSGNNVRNNGDYGIYLVSSSNNVLRSNSMAGNKYNFGVIGTTVASWQPDVDFSSWVNDVDFSNTVEGKPVYYWVNKQDMTVPPDAGYVALVGCTGITVQNLNLVRNGQGILLAFTTNTTITGNNVANENYGVFLYSSNGNGVSGNSVLNSTDGIYLKASSSNIVVGNTVTSSREVGVYVSYYSNYNSIVGNSIKTSFNVGISLDYNTNHNGVSGNNVTDNPLSSSGISLSGSNNDIFGNSITNNKGNGISAWGGNNNRILSNIINNDGRGLSLSSYNSSVSGNIITNNEYGIYMAGSGNTLTENSITANKQYGIELHGSNNEFSGNNITKNGIGVSLYWSTNNLFYHNNFVSNRRQLSISDSVNVWDDGYPSGGNYWSDYLGPDQNRDGLGDEPYYIDVDNRDRNPLMNPWIKPPVSVEKSFIESNPVETLLSQKAIVNNVTISGDLKGTLNFTSFEVVTITTGTFAGKGFSTGGWEATLEWGSYEGTWAGMVFLKPSERRIYMKGTTSGEIFGALEGYLSETVLGSGVYDRLQATWKIATTTTSAVVNLEGNLTYLSTSELPNTQLHVLQSSIEGSVYWHYNSSLSAVLTHVRVVSDNPYKGMGFSLISYTSDLGAGQGWTYDRLVSSGKVAMNGLFSSPLLGVVSGTLDEAKQPRTLLLRITRVDLGLVPKADLKVKIWGPRRISTGQTTTYTVEIRNDGLKSAENVTAILDLPYEVTYLSSTDEGVYNGISHEVVWRFENFPPKTVRYVTSTGTLKWGTPPHSTIQPIVYVPREVTYVPIDSTFSITHEVLEATENSVKMLIYGSYQSESGVLYSELYLSTVAEPIEPTFQRIQNGEEVTITYEFTIKGSAWRKVNGWLNTKAYSVWKWISRLWDGLVNDGEIWRNTEQGLRFLEWLEREQWIYQEDLTSFRRYFDNKRDAELPVTTTVGQVPRLGEYLSQGTQAQFNAMRTRGPWTQYELLEKIKFGPRRFEIPTGGVDELFTEFKKDPSHSITADSFKQMGLVGEDPNAKHGPEHYVSAGQTLNYTVEFENVGEGIAFGVYFTDTLDMDLDDSTLQIGPVINKTDGSVISGPGTYNPSTRTITWLVGEVAPRHGGYANVSVQVRNDAPEGTEIINYGIVYFPSVPETTPTNAIVSVVGEPRLAVTHVTPSTTLIEKGSTLAINVTVENRGYLAETFNLTLYANETIIQSNNVTVLGRTSDNIFFIWNTTGFPGGNYTISAYAEPVPGEVEKEDNLYVNGIVQVKVLDAVPPTTVLDVDEPKFTVDNTVYLTSTTPIALIAEDNPDGSGVASTTYRIYNSTYDSGWLTYTAPFLLTELTDGLYTIEFCSTDNVGTVEPTNTATLILDNKGPSLAVENPPSGWALQDGVTFIISAIDAGSGTSSVNFTIREANGAEGKPTGFENIPATYDAVTDKWTLLFDTLQLPDGYYIVIIKTKDNLGHMSSITVPYSIRNWAVIELLPASETNKAGRTMPVKFSLRVAASVDPNQPFVYNEDLTIKIYATSDPGNILQTSTFGDTSQDYRINTLNELYITNFQTLKTPMQYTVSVYRGIFLIDSFNFKTVK